jgi:hypothetical protein
MPARKQRLEPDLTTPLADTPLIPEAEFHDKLKAIFGPGGITKTQLTDHIAAHPHAPEKRGRKPKSQEATRRTE